jgi:hypothetical protein
VKTSFPLFITSTSMVLLLDMTGCRSTPDTSTEYPGVPIYAPSDPTLIEVLRAPPDRPNVRLGEIVVGVHPKDKISAQQIKRKLRQGAAKMGADAVLIVSDRAGLCGGIVTGPWRGNTLLLEQRLHDL